MLILKDAEKALVDRAIQTYGPSVVKTVLEAWLADRAEVFRVADSKALKDVCDAADQATKDQIKMLLDVSI